MKIVTVTRTGGLNESNFPTQASIPRHDTFHEVKHSYKKIFKKKKSQKEKKKVQYNPEDTTKSNITCPIGDQWEIDVLS